MDGSFTCKESTYRFQVWKGISHPAYSLISQMNASLHRNAGHMLAHQAVSVQEVHHGKEQVSELVHPCQIHAVNHCIVGLQCEGILGQQDMWSQLNEQEDYNCTVQSFNARVIANVEYFKRV